MKRYAIFFPQFYSIEVNDRAWGHGFTDWALVATANAFGYWQKRSPTSGFYDLSKDLEIRARFDSASTAGLDGFAIYHYRFDDGPELDAVEKYLRHEEIPEGFSYFFIWANENWSTRWVGGKILLLKEITSEPSRAIVAEHVNYLAPFMQSRFYSKIDGRPLFVFYRPESFAQPDVTLTLYREEFKRVGIDPLLGFFVKHISDIQYSRIFDFCYLFEPRLFFNFQGIRRNSMVLSMYRELMKIMSPRMVELSSEFLTRLVRRSSVSYSFARFLEYFGSNARGELILSAECPVQEVLTCGWNNAPRYRRRFTELEVPTVEEFSSMIVTATGPKNSRIELPILCNAWNEWSEGAAIEPCVYLGDGLLRAYLEAGRIKADER